MDASLSGSESEVIDTVGSRGVSRDKGEDRRGRGESVSREG